MPATPDFKERLKKITLRNMTVKHTRNKSWPIEKKIEVVSQFLVLGNMKMVAAITGVEHSLIRQWKGQPWWSELEAEIRQTQNIEIDTKLSKIVDKSLDATLDRIENGEFFYDQKTGTVKRKPANLRDVARVGADMISKRELIRGNVEEKKTTQVSISEQLKMLAAEFAKWNGKVPLPAPEVIDVVAKEVSENEDQGDQESQMADDSEFADEVLDSDDEGGLGSSDEGEPTPGQVDGEPGRDS